MVLDSYQYDNTWTRMDNSDRYMFYDMSLLMKYIGNTFYQLNKSVYDIYRRIVFIFNKYTDTSFRGVSSTESKNDQFYFLYHIYYMNKLFQISLSNRESQPDVDRKEFVNTSNYVIDSLDISFKMFQFLDDNKSETDFNFLLQNYIIYSFDVISHYFFDGNKMTDSIKKQPYYRGIFNFMKFIEENIHQMYQEGMTHSLYLKMYEAVKNAKIISNSKNTVFINHHIFEQIETMMNHIIHKKSMNTIDHYFIRIRCSFILHRINQVYFEEHDDLREKMQEI